jgi:hypothetical protein
MPRRVLDHVEDEQAQNYAALFDDRILRLQQELFAARHVAQEAEATLGRSIDQLKNAESLVAQADQVSCDAKHADDFTRLLEHPDIEFIEVGHNHIVLETGTIKIEHMRTTYTIGRFEITINIDNFSAEACTRDMQRREEYEQDPALRLFDEAMDDGEPLDDALFGARASDISIVNIDNVKNDICDHPHVREGLPCWGSIGPSITTLLQERRYPAVITLCIEFLKSYTDSGSERPYLRIENWADTQPNPDSTESAPGSASLDANDWPPSPYTYSDYDDDDVPF